MKQTLCRWLLFLVIAGAWTVPSASAADELKRVRRYEADQIEVRVFCDLGVYDDGQGGGCVAIYGMQVQDDGSEKVVWKHHAYRKTALLFGREYLYLPLNKDQVFLSFPGELENPFWELSRKTGTVVRTGKKDDAVFKKIMAEHIWHKLVIVDRPQHEYFPQTAE